MSSSNPAENSALPPRPNHAAFGPRGKLPPGASRKESSGRIFPVAAEMATHRRRAENARALIRHLLIFLDE